MKNHKLWHRYITMVIHVRYLELDQDGLLIARPSSMHVHGFASQSMRVANARLQLLARKNKSCTTV